MSEAALEIPVDREEVGKAYEVGYKRPPLHTRFKPGQSGNPLGKGRGLASAVRKKYDNDPTMLVDRWDDIAHGRVPAARVADQIRAGELLAAYGWGKPAATNAPEGYDPLELDAVTSEIRAIADELRGKREAKNQAVNSETPVQPERASPGA